MGLSTLIKIPCHHVLANEIDLNLKYCIGLKQFFDLNLGIDIIKKTTFFVHIFDISPCVFTQISIRRARWMRNSHHHVFSGISWFWRSNAHKKYAEWVLVGCGIHIQRALLIEI